MFRTTIMLPDSLKLELHSQAKKQKIPISELIRKALRYYLWQSNNENNQQDSFLSSKTVFVDDGPIDVSVNHDQYLIGSKGQKNCGKKKSK